MYPFTDPMSFSLAHFDGVVALGDTVVVLRASDHFR